MTNAEQRLAVFRVPLVIGSKPEVHPYIFNVNIRFLIQHIQGIQKNIGSLRCGGGCMVAICSPWPNRVDIGLISGCSRVDLG